jgi:DNA-binding SARP family transcriptional activator/tetratricopeptide (TPR) repeat protein/DNA-binding XRE family transcriptional regulator
MEQLPHELGELLRRHRRSAGMTQQELARHAGMSVRALRDLEHDRVRHPRAWSVQRLAAALRLDDQDRRGLQAVAGATATGSGEGLDIGLLGPLRVRRDGVAVQVSQARLRCLLGLLAVQPGQVVGRDQIVDALWGQAPPDTCLELVHTYVARLRGLLEPHRPRRAPGRVVVGAGGGYRLEVDAERLDMLRFDELAARAQHAQQAGEPETAYQLLGQALGVWRGPVLVDLDAGLRQHPAVVALAQRRLAVGLAYADLAIGLGRGGQAVAPLRMLGLEEPLHEGLHARLMLALAGCGQQAAALELFVQLRARLADELGIEPGTEVADVHLRILRQQLPGPAREQPGLIQQPDPGSDQAASAASPAPVQATPAQLPADVATFTGRTRQRAELDRLLAPGGDTTAIVISAIAGTAGVGKTALAVHWAHRVHDRFPNGQLYVNLRGYAPTPPVRPLEALAGFLHALGVPAEQVPVDLDEAAGVYRTLLTGRRMLVLLDNARSAEQVRPLLPGSPGCLVLVTSRDRLSGLVAKEGARRLILDVLTPDEAVGLLARILGEERVAAEPRAARELAEVCGLLPLALRIAAANLADQPGQSIAGHVARLRQGDRLAELAVDGDPQAAVGTAFDCSYATLDAGAQRLFRLLGLVPGPEVTPPGAAALVGMPVGQAARLLERLAGAHLLEPRAPGRFGFHDLLRRYAHQRVQDEDGEPERQSATSRLYSWYLHTADRAAGLLYPDRVRLPLPDTPAGLPMAESDEPGGALAWLDAERANLVAAVQQAAEHGPRPPAWLLADTLGGFFWHHRHLGDWIAVAHAGMRAAAGAGEPQVQAAAHRNLGMAQACSGDYALAAEHFTDALALARQAGWVDGQAACLGDLAFVSSELDRQEQAADHLTQALALHRQTGHKAGQAMALSNLGHVHQQLGRPEQAADHLAKAVALHHELGSRNGEAIALDNLAEVCRDLGRLDDARTHLSEALAVHREIGNRYDEAYDLNVLATVQRDAGHSIPAMELAQAALTVAREIGDPRIQADALNTLGSVHLRLGSPGQAVQHHQQALDLARHASAGRHETEALLGLAAACQQQRQHAQGDQHARQALTLASKAGYRVLEGQAHTILAAAHLARGHHGQAVEHAHQALAIHRRASHRLGQARTLVILGHALRNAQDADAAQPCWRQALALLTNIGSPEAKEVRALLDSPP